jgi:hypothetical protein
MVMGLQLFKDYFKEHTSKFILIGGTACDLVMEEADLAFRLTKDLDIVLCVEVIDEAFVNALWKFIRTGKYHNQQQSTGNRQFYRFKKPETEGYPFELEFFSRKPDILTLKDGSHLTPIPTDAEVSSLSAILLDDTYYEFIQC